MKVRSLCAAAILVNADKIVRRVATMRSSEKGRAEAKCHVVENDASVHAYGNNRCLTETIKLNKLKNQKGIEMRQRKDQNDVVVHIKQLIEILADKI